MNSKSQYGQYCPLAMSSEFLCNRWTMLVLRELLFGSTGFNDISRGVPRMSRTLLSNRLKELIERGIIIRQQKQAGGQIHYKLTEAGLALGPVVFSMAHWGQEWLEIEPSVKNVDVGFLMWDIHRNAVPMPELPSPFIVEFFLNDVPENKSTHWLVFEEGKVDLCHIDHGFDVDVHVDVSVKKLTTVWMGWEDMAGAIKNGSMKLTGAKKYTELAVTWLGHSSVAHIQKRSEEQRVS
ncbi:MAG: helix-turn-helix transcriptional regulator [Proteobacteria bacterium]|nr:helix-turn-helix transcriptional regulator [Pseudomonadota bacterium]